MGLVVVAVLLQRQRGLVVVVLEVLQVLQAITLVFPMVAHMAAAEQVAD